MAREATINKSHRCAEGILKMRQKGRTFIFPHKSNRENPPRVLLA
jgi:glutamine phosphoribosylpyrophosphate amidotransferase